MTPHSIRIATFTAALLALGALSASAQEEKAPPKEHSMPMPEHRMQHHADMLHMIESARTAADHEAVAKRFEAEAADFDKKAERHERLAWHYRKNLAVGPKGNAESLARHCENLIKNFKASAADAREMAKLHRDLGKALEK